MSTGPLAISAAVDDEGVRLYTKLADGTVVVEHNPTTQSQIVVAQRSEDQRRTSMMALCISDPKAISDVMQEVRPWYRQPGDLKCDPGSALATYMWKDSVAIFHEHCGRLKFWIDDRSIAQQQLRDSEKIRQEIPIPKNPQRQHMPGTQLAVTGCYEAGEVTLFYQDVEGYLCYRYTNLANWDEPVALHRAAKGTGIAAVSWSANKQIRVYFQDGQYNILEYCYSRDNWGSHPTGMATAKGLTTIAAVHWFGDETKETELRVYYQLGESGIQERCWSAGKSWHGTTILYDAFVADFNVLVFRRGEPSKPVLNLWIASKEGKVLLRRAYNRPNGWIPAIGHALPLTD